MNNVSFISQKKLNRLFGQSTAFQKCKAGLILKNRSIEFVILTLNKKNLKVISTDPQKKHMTKLNIHS